MLVWAIAAVVLAVIAAIAWRVMDSPVCVDMTFNWAAFAWECPSCHGPVPSCPDGSTAMCDAATKQYLCVPHSGQSCKGPPPVNLGCCPKGNTCTAVCRNGSWACQPRCPPPSSWSCPGGMMQVCNAATGFSSSCAKLVNPATACPGQPVNCNGTAVCASTGSGHSGWTCLPEKLSAAEIATRYGLAALTLSPVGGGDSVTVYFEDDTFRTPVWPAVGNVNSNNPTFYMGPAIAKQLSQPAGWVVTADATPDAPKPMTGSAGPIGFRFLSAAAASKSTMHPCMLYDATSGKYSPSEHATLALPSNLCATYKSCPEWLDAGRYGSLFTSCT